MAVVAGGASGSVLLVLLVAAGTIVARRRSLSRRRLTVGTPDARITGAWSEFTDALRLAGRPIPPYLAATEAAQFAATPAPPRRGLLRRAAPGTDRPTPAAGEAVPLQPARWEGQACGGNREPAPGEPAAGRTRKKRGSDAGQPPLPPVNDLVEGINTVGFAAGAADHALAERAGRQAVAYTTALWARRSWWRRLWWSVHPGPLRWHRDR